MTGLPGCGLAVLNTNYLKKDANSSNASFFNNTIWGSDGTVDVSNDAALICASCAPNFRPTYYTKPILMHTAAETNVNL